MFSPLELVCDRSPSPGHLGVGLMLRWYVVQSRAGSEKAAALSIGELGIETFLPTFARKVRHGRKTEEVVRPLFPMYLFARFDADDRASWGAILRARGVYTLLGLHRSSGLAITSSTMREGHSGAVPLPVPDDLVEDLQAEAAAGGGHIPLQDEPKLRRLKKHERVTITSGAFQGFEAFVQRDQKERVRVLLDFMGKQTPIVLHRESLAARL